MWLRIGGRRQNLWSVGLIVYHSPCLQNIQLGIFYAFKLSIYVGWQLPVIVTDFSTIQETSC